MREERRGERRGDERGEEMREEMREERRREEMREMERGALKTIPVEGGSASASEHTSRLRVQRHIQNKELPRLPPPQPQIQQACSN